MAMKIDAQLAADGALFSGSSLENACLVDW
jgi:hypothetical protein